ncbi:MAG: hypothetical protein ACO1OT_00075 [Heyndrickxia sp.]
MPLKGWILLAFCIFCSLLAIDLWNSSVSYNIIFLLEGMDTYPITVAGFHMGEASIQELRGYATAFKWVTLLPLSLAIVFYWKLLKVFRYDAVLTGEMPKK